MAGNTTIVDPSVVGLPYSSRSAGTVSTGPPIDEAEDVAQVAQPHHDLPLVLQDLDSFAHPDPVAVRTRALA